MPVSHQLVWDLELIVAAAAWPRHCPTPTAIFAGHDTLAIGVLRAVADSGLTADDVSVVGYDDIALARHPLVSLTTVDQFGVQMGATAVELLMERIRDRRTSPKQHQVEPELRIRGSSRASILG